MMMAGAFPSVPAPRIVATDLNRRVLAKAAAGRYSQLEVNRGLPAKSLVRHFTQQGRDWVLAGRIRHTVTFRELNLAGPWPHLGPFDLILCNPPYVNAQSMADLPAEYKAEPAMALSGNQAGGSDGMDFIRALLKDAPQHMTEDGVLVLEIGNEREHFETAFPDLPVFWLETSAGSDQVLLLTRQALLPLAPAK